MTAKSTSTRPAFDKVIADIADYAEHYRVKSPLALETAHYCLIDSLGCGFEAKGLPACTKLLGPGMLNDRRLASPCWSGQRRGAAIVLQSRYAQEIDACARHKRENGIAPAALPSSRPGSDASSSPTTRPSLVFSMPSAN